MEPGSLDIKMVNKNSSKSLSSYLYGLIAVALVIMLAFSAGIFMFFSEKSIHRLSWQLQEQVLQQVQRQLREYTYTASLINKSNQLLLEQGLIGLDDNEAWAKQFSLQAQQFDSISYITLAKADGSWFGLRNTDQPLYQYMNSKGDLYNHDLLLERKMGEARLHSQGGSSKDKAWYTSSLLAGRAVWTPIYHWDYGNQLAMSLGQPVYDSSKNLKALFAVDLSLSAISEFLRQFKLGKTGAVLIMDDEQKMVASSSFQAPFKMQGGRLQRIAVAEYGNAMLAFVGRHLQGLSGPLPENQQILKWKGQDIQILSEDFRNAQGLQWTLLTVVPSQELTEGVRTGLWWFLLAGLGVLLITLLSAGAYTRRWVAPLSKLAESVDEVRWLNLNQNFAVATEVREVQQLSLALQSMQAGLQSFARFVPRDMVRQILNQGEEAKLGGEERVVTVLFADIQGYSTFAEQLAPEQTILILNQYFQAMQEAIVMYGGTVLEHMGDSVMAVFSAPHLLQDHASNATRSALAMTDALQALNQRWEDEAFTDVWKIDGEGELNMRIGLHRGTVVAGNIGGTEYMKYGVIGDVVNVAARLEALNKDYETSIMLSRQVYEELDEKLAEQFVYRGLVSLKGRTQQQVVYSFND